MRKNMYCAKISTFTVPSFFMFVLVAEGKLYEKLLTGRKLVRPAPRWTDSVQVKVGFSLIQIRELVSI